VYGGPKKGHNWMCAARAGHRLAATSGSSGYSLSFKMKALCFIKMSETNSQRKSNKMQPCIKILFHIYMKLNTLQETAPIIRSLKLH
jgi:hypothetical protein